MAAGETDPVQIREKATDGLTVSQQGRIEHAVTVCRTQNGLDVSVFVGDLLLDGTDFHDGAERLHASLGPERSHSAVLLVVAPGQRQVDVVTGPAARRRVPDRVAALAVLAMTTAFTGGDLTGGILDALRQIADAAGRRPAIEAPPSVAPGTSVAVQH